MKRLTLLLTLLITSYISCAESETQTISTPQKQGKSLTSYFNDFRAYAAFGWNHDSAQLQNNGGKVTSTPYNGWIGVDYMKEESAYVLLQWMCMGGSYSGGVNNFTVNDTAINPSSFDATGYQNGWAIESRFGWQFIVEQMEGFTITPYIGFGFQSGHLSLSQDSGNNVQGVKIKSNTSYVPLGVILGWWVAPEFTLMLNLQTQLTLDGKANVTYPSDIGHQKLTRRANWLVELPLVYEMTEKWDMRLIPYFQYAKDSALYLGGISNKNDVWGGRLEVGYSF